MIVELLAPFIMMQTLYHSSLVFLLQSFPSFTLLWWPHVFNYFCYHFLKFLFLSHFWYLSSVLAKVFRQCTWMNASRYIKQTKCKYIWLCIQILCIYMFMCTFKNMHILVNMYMCIHTCKSTYTYIHVYHIYEYIKMWFYGF